MKIFKKLALIAVAAVSFAACDNNETKVDVTELNNVIAQAQTLLSSATTAEYSQDAIDVFSKTVNAIKAGVDKITTNEQAAAAVAQVNEAMATFKAAKYEDVKAENLTLSLSFDGNCTPAGAGKSWTVTPAAGPKNVFPTETLPVYEDGVKGKCVKLTNGANFQVTGFNAASLAGTAVSFSVWVKPSKVYANNYILSFNRWSSWKLQLQDGAKPFLTLYADNCVDMDNETDNSFPANEWHHLAVSADCNAKTVDFYVDGQLTKHWTEKISGTIKTDADGKDYFYIGQQCSWEDACKDDWFTPADANESNWSCFWGCIDELKVYNIALSAGQVSKIYNSEK